MTAIGLSADAGVLAVGLLTLNILLGLLISTRYSPWRSWPHRRINIFWFHNQTGWAALCACVLHPLLLLFSTRAGFHLLNIVFPAWAPRQPKVFLIGAAAIYTLVFVLITSHYRAQLGRRTWKTLHFSTYLLAGLAFTHGMLTDTTLRGRPVNFLSGGKMFVEACIGVVLSAIVLRVRHALRKTRPVGIARRSAPESTL